MSKKNKSAEYYYNKFNELYDSGLPIRESVTNEIFESEDNEEFKQCYADTPERRLFPKHWLISKKANLINVCEQKLQLVHKNPREGSGKFSYKFSIPQENGVSITKNIEAHNLVGLVFGSDSFGVAAEQLKEKGVYAFGVRSEEGINDQGHHKDGDDTNNDPSNILFVTDRVHAMFDSIPKPNASNDKEIAFMKRFGEIAKLENPNGITVLLPDHTYNSQTSQWTIGKGVDIIGTKEITVTENFLRELQTIIDFMYEDVEEEKVVNE